MTLLTALIAPAHADDMPAERQEYLAEQSRLTQETREISHNLLTSLTPLTGKEEDAFFKAMRNGIREGDPNFEILKAGLQAEFFKATDPKLKTDQQGLRILKQYLQNRLIGNAGVGIRGGGAKEEFRRLVCVETHKILKELLKNNHGARYVAIMLLPELQPVNPAGPNNPSRQILDDSALTLASILMDDEQPDSVKLNAAYAIGVYLDLVDPGGSIENKLTTALVSELESWLPADGYQLQLLDSLSRITTPREVSGIQRRAVPFDGLTSVLQDKRRSYLIRCRAAGALGTVGYDDKIRFDPLAWKIAQLAAETGSAWENQPALPHWQKCGEQLFLAFRPSGDQDAEQTDGLLNRAPRSEKVRGAYVKVLPIAAGLILSQGVDESLISEAATWASENVPDNLAYDPASPPLQP